MLTPYIPYPVNSGGNQVLFGLIDRLRKYIDISIIFSAKDSDMRNLEELQVLWPDIKFYIFNRNENNCDTDRYGFWYKRMISIKESIDRKIKRKELSYTDDLVRKKSVLNSQAKPFYFPDDEEYVNFVYKTIEAYDFDLIQVDFFELINIVNILPDNIKKVFIHHELRYVRAEREVSLFQSRGPMDEYMLRYSKNYEIQCLNSYNAIVTLSDTDKDKLSQELKADIPVFSSPVIVSLDTHDSQKAFKFNNRLVFLGGSDHFPNLDAINWFLNNCWNRILKKHPHLELHIIGQWKSKLKKEYTEQFRNVFFQGFVNDLSTVLENTVMIVPIRIGSGIRIKILDALSHGIPVITSTVGGEGLDLTDGQNCIIADTSDDYLQAVDALCNNTSLYKELSLNAKKSIDSRPDPESLAEIRLNIYKDILKSTAN